MSAVIERADPARLTKDKLVVYHGRCPDGFGAALSAWLALGDSADYLPADYTDPAPDVTGKDVYIVDFCYPRKVMEQLNVTAGSITLLDHHATARDNLKGFECSCGRIHFDMTKSGARLAWEFFHPEKPVPPLIAFIEDRDLWRFNVPGTREFLAYLDTQEPEFKAWAALLSPEGEAFEEALGIGTLLHGQYLKFCRSAAEQAVPLTLAGETGLMISGGEAFKSDAGAILANQCGTFAAIWYIEPKGTIKVSLRSLQPFDVRKIAEKFGGGGHEQAASFRVPRNRGPELMAGYLPVKRPNMLARMWRALRGE